MTFPRYHVRTLMVIVATAAMAFGMAIEVHKRYAARRLADHFGKTTILHFAPKYPQGRPALNYNLRYEDFDTAPSLRANRAKRPWSAREHAAPSEPNSTSQKAARCRHSQPLVRAFKRRCL